MIQMRWAQVKKQFFDRAHVKASMDRATHSALNRFGARTRLRARHSIRKRKKISAVGSPPSSHPPHRLREWIVYAYEPGMRPNVVIGPVLTDQSARAAKALGTTVPRVLEEGGEISLPKRGGGTRRAHVGKRPYMGPAFDIEIKKAAGLWRGKLGARVSVGPGAAS